MNRLLTAFGSLPATIICVLFAIANRIIFATLYSQIGTDTRIQLTYTQNLLSGKGMGVTKYFTQNLETAIVDPQQMFPPGFSLAIIPFLTITGDEFRAVFVFDAIASVLFVIVVRLLGKKADLCTAYINILTIIAGCFQFLFFMSWSSTDAISLCFLLFALAMTVDIINKKNDLRFLRAVAMGALFCLPFFFRYMYLPIALFLPFSVLAFGFLLKNRSLRSAGFKVLISSAAFLLLIFAFNINISGNALFVHDFGRGIYMDQLRSWYPFLPASFINLDFAAQLVARFTRLTYNQFLILMEVLNPVLVALLIFGLWRYIVNHKKKIAFSGHSLFIVTGSGIALLILLLLAYLTLTYKAIAWGNIRWTHSQDERYFSFIYIFSLVLLFVCLQHYRSFINKPLIRVFVFIALTGVAVEIMHGIYYNIKIATSHKDLMRIKEADQGYRNFFNVIEQLEKKYPGRNILVSSPDQYYLHAASQRGYKAIFDYENLWQADLKPSSESVLLMPVHEQEASIMQEYVDRKKPQLYSIIAGTYFYTEEIDPR